VPMAAFSEQSGSGQGTATLGAGHARAKNIRHGVGAARR
jgi:hypothetical protein